MFWLVHNKKVLDWCSILTYYLSKLSLIYHNKLLKKQVMKILCPNFVLWIFFALFVLLRMLYSMAQYWSTINFQNKYGQFLASSKMKKKKKKTVYISNKYNLNKKFKKNLTMNTLNTMIVWLDPITYFFHLSLAGSK